MPKQKINAQALVSQIRGGMSYRDLLTKHNVTVGALDRLLQQLVSSGLIQYEELPQKPPSTCSKCGLPLEDGKGECKGCAIVQHVFEGEEYQPVISLKDLVASIKGKSSFENLRLRHTLSEAQLRKLLDGLLEAEIIKKDEDPRSYRPPRSQFLLNLQPAPKELGEAAGSEGLPFCHECGQKRVEGSKFCVKCGTKLGVASVDTVRDSHANTSTGKRVAQSSAKKEPPSGHSSSPAPSSSHVLGGILIAIFVAISFCYVAWIRHQPSEGTPSGTSGRAAQVSERPAISIGMWDLSTDYKVNEVAADRKYKGRILEVTDGAVWEIGKDMRGKMYVRLGSEQYDPSNSNLVQCYFSDETADDLAQLRRGQHVVIRGECAGWMMGSVLLRNCDLVR